MPIDYVGRRNQAQEALARLVAGRNIGDEISQIRGNVGKQRSDFSSAISGVTPTFSRDLALKVPLIDARTNALIAQKNRGLQTEKYQTVFNNALDSYVAAGHDVQSASAFARQIADQQTQQAFLSGEAEKARLHQQTLADLRSQYAQKGVDLENQYRPQFDYGAALTRVLLGTGTAIGTGAYLNNRYLKSLKQPARSMSSLNGLNYQTIPNETPVV